MNCESQEMGPGKTDGKHGDGPDRIPEGMLSIKNANNGVSLYNIIGLL